MIASFLIIGFSLLLLLYWFRYSCVLLLRAHAEQAALAPSAEPDIRFCFAEVQARLKTAPVLDPLHVELQRDYQILIYLLQHAAGLSLESFEDRLLVLDYKVMQWWYCLTRVAAPEQARRALYEMASILIVLAQKMGEQAGVQTEA